MRYILALSVLFLNIQIIAQPEIQETISVDGQEEFIFDIEYGDAKISTWDGDEIIVEAVIEINDGQNNDIHSLRIDKRANSIRIVSRLDDQDLKFVAKKTSCKTDKKVCKESADGVTYNSYDGNYVEIMVLFSIKVPEDMEIDVTSLYGDIELANPQSRTRVHNTYGGITATVIEDLEENLMLKSIYKFVDITLDEDSSTDLSMETSFGNLYSDFDIEVENKRRPSNYNFSNKIRANLNGGGQHLKLSCTYGNVYLRKYEKI